MEWAGRIADWRAEEGRKEGYMGKLELLIDKYVSLSCRVLTEAVKVESMTAPIEKWRDGGSGRVLTEGVNRSEHGRDGDETAKLE